MEISGYPHYENVCSNILQFYLNPQNEHGLQDLVLKSLIKIVDTNFNFDCTFEQIQVEREIQTLASNRLDLLIQTPNFVVGIENKVFHFLNNDLTDYSKTILSYCSHTNKKPINIILSLNKLSNKEDIEKAKANNFINITYEDLFTSIKMNIGDYLFHSNPTYFILLTDFIKSIQNLKPATMDNKLLWNFFKENSEIVEELSNRFNDYKNFFNQKSYQLLNVLPKEVFAPKAYKQWIYDKFCLVHDYTIENKYSIASDTYCDMKGWQIQLFGRNKASNEYLINTMCKTESFLPKPIDQYERNERLIFQRFATDTEIEIVAETLKDLLTRIESYKNLTDISEIPNAR